MFTFNKSTVFTLGCLLAMPSAFASEEEPLVPGETAFGATFVVTEQFNHGNTVNSELLYSIDLDLTQQFDGWGAFVWLEHSKSTRDGDVSQVFGNANADAGTAQYNNGQGRTQISELYVFGDVDESGNHGWQFGLNEVTTLIDKSTLANDEVSQFLSLGLINNMSIAFPDYAVSGLVQDMDAFDEFGYRLVLSSSHGVQDNPDYSYPELFEVDASNKGMFSAAELVFEGLSFEANIGYWQNTSEEAGADYGLYVGVDYFTSGGKYNFRYSQANAGLDSVEQFTGVTYQKEIGDGILAAGYTLTRFNRDVDPLLKQVEVYYRKPVSDTLSLTPSVQWVDGTDLIYQHDQDVVFGLRLEFSM